MSRASKRVQQRIGSLRWVAAALLCVPGTAFCQQAKEGFPADSGVVNVRDYGALGDGKHDDTEGILKAIAAAGPNVNRSVWQEKIVYLPDGIYLISAPLIRRYSDGSFASGMVLIGQSEKGTTLKLKDRVEGYQDASHPRAMIFTSSKLQDRGGPYGGGKDYPALGEGNDAFRNGIENLTVDAGAGNAGAIAIDYLASNVGAIRHVTVQGGGSVGIAMTRKWIGPALLDHVTVHGFAVGISVANPIYGVTLNHVAISGSGIGLMNDKNMIAANDLRIHSMQAALINKSSDGEVVLADSVLETEAGAAVENQAGVIVFHHSSAQGSELFATKGMKKIDGYLSGPQNWTPLDAANFTPIPDPPVIAHDPVSAWVNVERFGAKAVPFTDLPGAPTPEPIDSYEAFQKAFKTGASTIYLPHGTYYISHNLVVPPSVKRIVGMNSTLAPYRGRGYELEREQGIVRIVSRGANDAPLELEHLAFYNLNGGPQWGIEDASTRTLLLRDSFFSGAVMMHRAANGGPVFLSDTNSGGRNIVEGKAPFNAVQLNMENCDICLTSRDTPLNILNVKTETDVTTIDATRGSVQIVGGLLYIVRKKPDPEKPAFRIKDSPFNISFVEVSFQEDTSYKIYLAHEEKGKKDAVAASLFPLRNDKNESRLIPWLAVKQ